jgi:hypothetical protein
MDRIFGGSRCAVTVRTAVHIGPRGLPVEEVPAPLFNVHGPSLGWAERVTQGPGPGGIEVASAVYSAALLIIAGPMLGLSYRRYLFRAAHQ